MVRGTDNEAVVLCLSVVGGLRSGMRGGKGRRSWLWWLGRPWGVIVVVSMRCSASEAGHYARCGHGTLTVAMIAPCWRLSPYPRPAGGS